MTEVRKLKKSESLEIRLPYPTKQAFMARCRAEGLSASEALRRFIEAKLQPPPRRRRLGYAVAAGLGALAIGAAAAPSLARPAAGAPFRALDADGDGAVTAAELARLDADSSGGVTEAEFRSWAGRPARP